MNTTIEAVGIQVRAQMGVDLRGRKKKKKIRSSRSDQRTEEQMGGKSVYHAGEATANEETQLGRVLKICFNTSP